MKPIDAVKQMLAELVGGPDTPYLERRAQSEKFGEAFALPPGVRIEKEDLGGVPVEWVIPEGSPLAPALLHLHGGGYVLGNPAGSRPFTTAFALKSRARVVSVDYRLAPEYPFPAAVDDVLSVYRALLGRGYRSADLAVGGESAGGGLAIALLLAAKQTRLALPASAFAISPWTDIACTAQTFDTRAHLDPLLTRRSLKEMGDAYLAGQDSGNPLASPRHGDLSGLPPLLIHVGSDEVLLDDARALHAQASAARVDCKLDIWDGMIHVWHMFHPMLPEGDAAIGAIVDFVNSHWRRR